MLKIFRICIIIMAVALSAVTLERWTQGAGGIGTDYGSGNTAGLAPVGTPYGPSDQAYLGFWIPDGEPEINYRFNRLNWTIPESLDVLQSREMLDSEKFTIINGSNCRLTYGIMMTDVSPLAWTPGTVPGHDAFVLLARFSDTVPIFHLGEDYIDYTMKWADTYFGGDGTNVLIGEEKKLWMNITMPFQSSEWGLNHIEMEFRARMYIP